MRRNVSRRGGETPAGGGGSAPEPDPDESSAPDPSDKDTSGGSSSSRSSGSASSSNSSTTQTRRSRTRDRAKSTRKKAQTNSSNTTTTSTPPPASSNDTGEPVPQGNTEDVGVAPGGTDSGERVTSDGTGGEGISGDETLNDNPDTVLSDNSAENAQDVAENNPMTNDQGTFTRDGGLSLGLVAGLVALVVAGAGALGGDD